FPTDYTTGWIILAAVLLFIHIAIIHAFEESILSWDSVKVPLILSLMVFFNGQVICFTTSSFRRFALVLPSFVKTPEGELLERWYAKEYEKMTSDKMMVLFGVVFGFIVQLYINYLGLQYEHLISNAFTNIVVFIVTYFSGIGLYMMIATAYMVDKIADLKLRKFVYQHPKKSVKSIGKLFFMLSFCAIIMYFLYAIWFIFSGWDFGPLPQAMFVTWGVIIIGYFIVPQIKIHRILVDNKHKLLNSLLPILEDNLKFSIEKPSKENIKRHSALLLLHQEVEKMKTWPFDPEALITLISAIVIPLVIVGIQMYFG
ncbi:MAG: hypothetical protein KAS04_06880, partial [Candidatus Aenigmarchaeota archaeon]|nr:hypothetical protein [Candidatus Aenigmarchaeota archaeon]